VYQVGITRYHDIMTTRLKNLGELKGTLLERDAQSNEKTDSEVLRTERPSYGYSVLYSVLKDESEKYENKLPRVKQAPNVQTSRSNKRANHLDAPSARLLFNTPNLPNMTQRRR
jgi:hypothetical protein